MSLSFFSIFFLALPAPVKVVLIVVGGLFYNVRAKEQVGAVRVQEAAQAEAQAVPADKPAKVIAAVPVQPAKAAAPVIVIVNSDGSYNVGAAKLTGAELSNKLKSTAALDPKTKILIKADALTPHQMVISAVTISKKAGLSNVSFSSKPDPR